MNVLEKILSGKRQAVRDRKTSFAVADLRARIADMQPAQGFVSRLKSDANPMALIAEIKKASPSKGIITADFDPVRQAEAYESGGASCISVLTDEEYFQGSTGDLVSVRNAVDLPVLRKDFVVDELCIFETRHLGADCLLLIAAAFSKSQLQDYVGLSSEVGIDTLVEVHSADEMGAALDSGSELIGINNRDLATFQTDLSVTEMLAPLAPGRFVVSESAISCREDVVRAREAGAQAVLVGEALMREDNPAEGVRRLLGR